MFSINGAFLSQPLTGVQRYAHEITKAMSESLINKPKNTENERTKPRLIFRGKQVNVDNLTGMDFISTPELSGPIWNQAILPFYSRGMLFSFGNIGPLGYKNQTICIHDANVYATPQSYKLNYRAYHKSMLPLMILSARHITTVSKFSREMLWKHAASPGKDIRIIPNGREHVYRWNGELSRLSQRNDLRSPFILVIGSRAQHKNVQIIEEISSSLREMKINIVIAGGVGNHFSQIKRRADSNIIELGYVSDDDLAFLYGLALCLVFPSITEGFGIPPLEAMTLGCPVICSNTASLPEVCGRAVLYSSPFDPASWITNIAKISSSLSLREDLASAGKEQSAIFSWQESAKDYLDLV